MHAVAATFVDANREQAELTRANRAYSENETQNAAAVGMLGKRKFYWAVSSITSCSLMSMSNRSRL